MTGDALLKEGQELLARIAERERKQEERRKSLASVVWTDDNGGNYGATIPRDALIKALQK